MTKKRSIETTETRLPDAQRRFKWPSVSWDGRAVRVLFGLAASAVVVVLIMPAGPHFTVPTPGLIAQRDYRASRDFEVMRPNPRYEEEVRKASNAVFPVYEYVEDLAEKKGDKVVVAFSNARLLVETHKKAVDSLEQQRQISLSELKSEMDMLEKSIAGPIQQGLSPAEKEDAQNQIDSKKNRLARLNSDVKDIENEFSARLSDEKSRFARELAHQELEFRRELRLSPRFDTVSFETLMEDRFSTRSEETLRDSLKAVFASKIVRDLDRLEERLRRGIRSATENRIYYLDQARAFLSLEAARMLAIEETNRRFAERAGTPNLRLQNAIAQIAEAMVEENFIYSPTLTQLMEDEAIVAIPKDIPERFQNGQQIVGSGQRITDRHAAIIEKMLEMDSGRNRLLSLAGVVGLVFGLFVLMWLFARNAWHRLVRRPRDIVLFLAISVVETGMLRLSQLVTSGIIAVWDTVGEAAFYFAMPVAFGTMLTRLFLGPNLAVVFLILQGILIGVMWQDRSVMGLEQSFNLYITLYLVVSSLGGSLAMVEIRQRTSLFRASVTVGFVNVVMVAVVVLLTQSELHVGLLYWVGGGLIGGILNYFLLVALTPAFETIFGYVTDIKLLELANVNQPSLKELSMRAPGTYQHSIMVGNLAESAAEAIGANPLMTRIGAYYHDLGKMRNPRYFAENQPRGENPHDKLKPHMSALIIKNHVKDGIEIARKHRLPQDIVDFIPEHHGNALIGFFYARAKEQANLAGGPDVDENDFRYPGPKPQRRETALVMLADGCEAAVRSLPDPSPVRIRALVKKIVNSKFMDGQLDECDLSFKDMNAIVQSFNRALLNIYHARPVYPQIPGEEERARARLGISDESESRTGVVTPDLAGLPSDEPLPGPQTQ
ncbi:MAG: HDIG domain-containing protein [Myxococcales bacterium]|nr:HDIG domain-containing protein [Myxococcales bacterium]